MLQRQHSLHKAGDPGRSFQVADVGLDRPDVERVWTGPAEDSVNGAQFDGVTKRSAGAVRLDVADLVRLDLCVGQGSGQQLLLGAAVGYSQPAAGPIVVDGASPNQRQHRVSIRFGVGQPLEQHHACPLPTSVAVGGRIEGLAAAIWRERLHLRERHIRCRGQQQADRTGQRQVALAAAQALAGQMNRHQRRGAGSVHRQRRPLHAQRVRQPSGSDAVADPGRLVGLQARQIMQPGNQRIVALSDPDKDPGAAVDQTLLRQPAPFERFPAHFQEQPVLRVQTGRLPRGNAKKKRVELVDLVEEGAGPRVHLASFGALWIVERINFPTFSWNGAHPVLQAAQNLPEGFRAVSPREAAGHADDGNRVGWVDGWDGLGGAAALLWGWLARLGWRGYQKFAQQIFGQGSNGRVFENNCCRDFGRRGAFQAAAQLHRHQRIHAEIGEAAGDAGWFGHAEDEADHLLQGALQMFQASAGRQGGQLLLPGGERCRASLWRDKIGEEGRGLLAVQPTPVDQGDTILAGAAQQLFEGQQCQLGSHELRCIQPALDCGGAGGHATVSLFFACPGPPVEAEAGQPLLLAAAGQPIQKCVAGGVGPLTWVSQQGRNRREKNHEVQVHSLGQGVQQPAALHLGAEHLFKARPALVKQDSVVQNPGHMHHPSERPARIAHRLQPLEQLLHGSRVGNIELGNLYLHTLCCQPLEHSALCLGGDPAPAGQQQMGCPLSSQPFGHMQTQRTQPAGHQIGCTGMNRQTCGRAQLLCGEPDQPGHVALPPTPGQLRLALLTRHTQLPARTDLLQQCPGRRFSCCARVEIDQPAKEFRMLQRHDLAQPPQRALCDSERLPLSQLLSSLCDQPEPSDDVVCLLLCGQLLNNPEHRAQGLLQQRLQGLYIGRQVVGIQAPEVEDPTPGMGAGRSQLCQQLVDAAVRIPAGIKTMNLLSVRRQQRSQCVAHTLLVCQQQPAARCGRGSSRWLRLPNPVDRIKEWLQLSLQLLLAVHGPQRGEQPGLHRLCQARQPCLLDQPGCQMFQLLGVEPAGPCWRVGHLGR